MQVLEPRSVQVRSPFQYPAPGHAGPQAFATPDEVCLSEADDRAGPSGARRLGLSVLAALSLGTAVAVAAPLPPAAAATTLDTMAAVDPVGDMAAAWDDLRGSRPEAARENLRRVWEHVQRTDSALGLAPIASGPQSPNADFDGYWVLSHVASEAGAPDIAGGALRGALGRASSPFEKLSVAREAMRQQDATLARQATVEAGALIASGHEGSSRDCALLADVEGRLGAETAGAWRWGQERPCGSPVADAADAVVRVHEEAVRLPDGTLLHDQYSVYLLQRDADGRAAWHDLARGTRMDSAGLLRNGVDSGEVLQLLVPLPAGQRHLLVGRGSTFMEEAEFPAGATYRSLLQSQVRRAVRSRAARDGRFRAKLQGLGVDVRSSSREDLTGRLPDLATALRAEERGGK